MKTKMNLAFKLSVIFVASVCFTIPFTNDNSQQSSPQLTQEQLSKQEGKWYYFKKGTKIPVEDLIKNNYTFFDLPQGISSRIEKTDVDELGMTHYMLKLEINDIPIDDAYYTAHYSKEGDLMHVVGKYEKDIIPAEVATPKISIPVALQLALDAFLFSENISIKDLFDMVKAEQNKLFNDKKVTPYLVYYRPDKNALKLCYRVDISSDILEVLKNVYIDALNGAVIKIIDNRLQNIATVATVYNGSREVQVEWRGWPYSYYYLRDDSESTDFETRNSSIHDDYPWCVPWGFGNLDRVYKGDLNWPIDFKANAASAHWALTECYNVFKYPFYRNYGTFPSAGGEIRLENNYLTAGPFYDFTATDDYIHVGQTVGTNKGYEGSLDIIGHEFTHGVMYRDQGVGANAYSHAETGELMESFADIFGTVIEHYTLDSPDWIVGTNLRPSCRRSLSNPRAYSTYAFSPTLDGSCKYYFTDSTEYVVPTYYDEDDYFLDYSGSVAAHVNCSVQNYWFYLLSEGGSQLGVTVTGIGLYKAAMVAYRNMVYYFTPVYEFDDMRQASIANAINNWGECSNEHIQVQNVWAAVNVGTQGTPCLSAQILGPDNLDYGVTGQWNAYVHGGTGTYYYTWYIDYDYFSSNSSITNAFYPDEVTEYTITLEVTDGSLYDYDELYLTVYPEEKMQSSATNQLDLEIYPNPATESTTIEIKDADVEFGNDQYIIKLVDQYGNLLLSKNLYSKKLEINTSHYKPGIYSIIVQSGKKYANKKLIIN